MAVKAGRLWVDKVTNWQLIGYDRNPADKRSLRAARGSRTARRMGTKVSQRRWYSHTADTAARNRRRG